MEDAHRYPKVFLVLPNTALLPPEECLPHLFSLGLEVHLIERHIGLGDQVFLEDIFLRVNIAFELFPTSFFLFNVNINKLPEQAWIPFRGGSSASMAWRRDATG